MLKIAINAGHGLKNSGIYDPGAIGPGGLAEAVQNLEVAKALEQKLHTVGFKTLLIQDGDLDDIGRQTNAWQADYFIAIHCNASSYAPADGVETYALLPGGRGERIAKAIQNELVRATGLPNRGVKYADFQVLKATACPAVLVEAGFISNPATEKLMRQAVFDEKVAEAIFKGLIKEIGIPFIK
jgi:N-acetylmuramoyl-L-alanine amidase